MQFDNYFVLHRKTCDNDKANRHGFFAGGTVRLHVQVGRNWPDAWLRGWRIEEHSPLHLQTTPHEGAVGQVGSLAHQ